MTSSDFLKIFYSNSPLAIDWDNLNEIEFMYNEGFFSVISEVVASNSDFISRIDYVGEPKNGFMRDGESYSHLALKTFGRDYLINLLNIPKNEVLYEQVLDGFEVDVIDRSHQFPIECGDTNALKLEKYLTLPTTNTFLIIPYPRQGNIIIYKFSAKEGFFGYLEFKKEYLKKIRTKLR